MPNRESIVHFLFQKDRNCSRAAQVSNASAISVALQSDLCVFQVALTANDNIPHACLFLS